MKFTGTQAEAIRHRDGNLQLIARAGSGKTEVARLRESAFCRIAKPKAAGDADLAGSSRYDRRSHVVVTPRV